MILTVWYWHCTLCGYSKNYDPEVTSPPEICPACHDGHNTSITYEADKK